MKERRAKLEKLYNQLGEQVKVETCHKEVNNILDRMVQIESKIKEYSGQ